MNEGEILDYLNTRIREVNEIGVAKDRANYEATGNDYDTVAGTEWAVVAELEMVRDMFTVQDDYEGDGEPMGSFDLSDDAEALASAGWGTDEDYGFYGYEGEWE